MKYKELGKTREKLSAIGIGTWNLSRNKQDNKKAIEIAIDKGVNFIDTAEIYKTEEFIGEIIEGRKDLFIATKVWGANLSYNKLIKACENSLRRLKINQIDLYQIHFPNPRIKISETMKAMEKLVDDGKIRYIGVSNFNTTELSKAAAAMKKYEIVSNQVEYNLITRKPEIDLIPYMAGKGMTLIAYSPFAHGAIFKKRYRKIIEKLDEIGKNYGKNAAQVMLNWLAQNKITIPIVKASNPEHMKEDIEAMDFSLSQEDIIKINGLTSQKSNNGMSRFKPIILFYLMLRSLF